MEEKGYPSGQPESRPERGDTPSDHKGKLYKSFGYAFRGIGRTIRHERNMQIHCCAAVLVVIFGLGLGLTREEWFVCFLLFALVMSLECVNTAVEAVVDLASPGQHPLAEKAKDAAAGAVLIAAIFAAVIGLWIFVPKLWAVLFG